MQVFCRSRMHSRVVTIGGHRLEGSVAMPEHAAGVVVFAHGSGSSRLSPRNTAVARDLNARGFATLLFDLLTELEAEDRSNVFDIELLGKRVGEAVLWARRSPQLESLPIGLFGASTGAAAALVAAANAPEEISAVVSRGGRPDLAGAFLPLVRAPTLLIVGGADLGIRELNEQALEELTCEKRLDIVPRATHLFEEPGTLEVVVDLAASWFRAHMMAYMGTKL